MKTIFVQSFYYPGAINECCPSQWLRGLRHGCEAANLLGLRFRIPPETWMSVLVTAEFCQVQVCASGLNTRSEESYRVWCV